VLYQIYVRSFADSNGDGIGDLPGILSHLDHLVSLGVDGVWLSPVTVSPNADWGYDVADYLDVSPELGTLADLDALIGACSERDIRVLLDLVPNHTSDRHPWFLDARRSRDAEHRDYYVWADPGADGGPPNNWVSAFGGPAWSFEERSGQYYLHNFLPEQPDLNWWNPKVRDAFEGILAFWFDRGVAGFRIDVCHMIVKDAQLRDNPPATKDDPFVVQVFGQRSVYNANQPEVHDVLRSWRRLADAYSPPRVLLGETNVEDLATLVSYYGNGADELDLGFNFPFIEAPFEVDALAAVVETTESLLPRGAWPVWTGSNHDVSRLATRWAGGDPSKTRLALLMLLTLRGTPVLYQGDEIGLTDTTLERDDLLDPVGLRYWPAYAGRDPVRTPMPWRDGPGGGFCPPGVRPWLPLGDPAAGTVADQALDPASTLAFTRDLIALRRASPDLSSGEMVVAPSGPGVWRWRRGERTTVVLNLSDAEVRVLEVHGHVSISTDRRRDGERLNAATALGPWEGLVIEAPD
jgi:alpha-glucosidase